MITKLSLGLTAYISFKSSFGGKKAFGNLKRPSKHNRESSSEALSKLLDNFGGIFKNVIEKRQTKSKSPSLERRGAENRRIVEEKRLRIKMADNGLINAIIRKPFEDNKKVMSENVIKRVNLVERIHKGNTSVRTASGRILPGSKEIFTSFEGFLSNLNTQKSLGTSTTLTSKYSNVNPGKSNNIHVMNKRFFAEIGKKKVILPVD